MDSQFPSGDPFKESEIEDDVGAFNPISDDNLNETHKPGGEETGDKFSPVDLTSVHLRTPTAGDIDVSSISWKAWIYIIVGILLLLSVPFIRTIAMVGLFAAFAYFEARSIWETYIKNTEYLVSGISGFYVGVGCLAGVGILFFTDHWDTFKVILGQK